MADVAYKICCHSCCGTYLWTDTQLPYGAKALLPDIEGMEFNGNHCPGCGAEVVVRPDRLTEIDVPEQVEQGIEKSGSITHPVIPMTLPEIPEREPIMKTEHEYDHDPDPDPDPEPKLELKPEPKRELPPIPDPLPSTPGHVICPDCGGVFRKNGYKRHYRLKHAW